MSAPAAFATCPRVGRLPSRQDVETVHQWAVDRGHEILRPPQLFPEYGDNCYATFFVDAHNFMLEATCHTAPG